MGNWMREAEKSHNKRVFAGYEEYKQRVKDLRVTPLVLPYDVQQEVFGLDEKGTRYPVYPSDHFDVTPGFSHPELQNTWFSFKWYPHGVHAGGVVKMGELYTESSVGSRLPTRHVLVPGGYTIFVPNVPESEQAS